MKCSYPSLRSGVEFTKGSGGAFREGGGPRSGGRGVSSPSPSDQAYAWIGRTSIVSFAPEAMARAAATAPEAVV